MLPLVLLIGGFHYNVVNDCKSMGAVDFPLDDSKTYRAMKVCREIKDQQQLKIVAEHELHHICYHNHSHEFKTKEELQEHINYKYTEEDSIDIVSQCVVENRSLVYGAFGVH